jgi:phosphatidylglycerophosphate synthase
MTTTSDPPSYRRSLDALRAAQKPPRGVSLYSLYVNRPIGRRIAALAHVLGLSPNQLTVLSAVSSFGAMALLVTLRPTVATGIAAGFLLALGFAFDSADGQVARLLGSGNRRGEWLDHMVDCAVKLGLHLAVFVGFDRYTHAKATLLIPLAYLVVAILIFFGGTLAAKLLEHAVSPGWPERREARGGASRFLLIPADHGTLCLSFLLWGESAVFLFVYSVLLVANSVLFAAYARNWWRDLK